MKSKFKAWAIAHNYCFGLVSLGEWFMEDGVSYGADGYPRESSPPSLLVGIL